MPRRVGALWAAGGRGGVNDFLARATKLGHGQAWLLAGILLVIFPHTFYQPVLVTLSTVSLLSWRFLHDLGYLKLPPASLRNSLAFLAFVAVFYGYHSILGRDAGVALLLVMLTLKLMEMKDQRDINIVVCLGYFVVITGFLFDQSLLIALYMLSVVFCLTTALITFQRAYAPKAAQHVNGKIALSLIAQAFPLTLLLFFLFPRIPGPLWGLPDDPGATKSGLSDTMSPGLISELSLDDSVAFRVRFDGTMPPASLLYWRGPVFTYYDGLTWRAIRREDDGLLSPTVTGSASPSPEVKTDSRVKYDVILEPHDQNWLFALDLPVQLPMDTRLSENYELWSSRPVKALIRYQVQSFTNYRLDSQHKPEHPLYRQTPLKSSAQARRFALELRQSVDPTKPYDGQMKNKVLDYLREQPFYYTRSPPLMLRDPIDEFLFESRKGFCEHYASAFVFLMRAADIPARIVTGYLGGEVNPIGNYLTVRQSDAHAWAEVWLKNQGWVRVDPTAVIPPERILQAEFRERRNPAATTFAINTGWAQKAMQQFKFGWDNLNYVWQTWVVGYNSRSQSSLLDWLGLERYSWNGLTALLFSGLSLALGVVALIVLRQTRHPMDAVQQSYATFCRKLSRRGITRLPSESASNFAKRVSELRPDLEKPVKHITALYNRSRYTAFCSQQTVKELVRMVGVFNP